ncbi:MAG TPA: DUF4855 domain-containing protein [Actinopolymorphaceae bacterium]
MTTLRSLAVLVGCALVSTCAALSMAPTATARTAASNVAAGAPYTVTRAYPDDHYHQLETGSYPDVDHELTDGRRGSLEFTDPAWVGYAQQLSRDIVVDLRGTKTVRRLTTNFLYYPSAGIVLPATVRYSLSLDGRIWRVVGSTPGDNRAVRDTTREVTLDIAPTYARFVKVSFDVNGWAFTDEIAVLGTEGREAGARPPSGPIDRPEDPSDNDYLAQGTARVGGVRDMYLAYTYDTRSENAELGTWRHDDLLPVIGHLDADGRPTDRMFDSVLFMAGGSELDGYQTKDRWADLLDRLFAPGVNVDALDAAAGTLRRALDERGSGAAGATVKVVLPIPNPVPHSEVPWGTLDGEELDLNPARVGNAASTANRLKVVRWYVDEALERYRAAHHDRLELVGFYWMREAIPPRSLDSDLVALVAKDLHRPRGVGRGPLKFYWIPYYVAQGFQHWESYGFDASMMQPNFFFDAGLPPTDTERLERTAELARWTGQGVELEGDRPMLTDPGARTKFLGYLETFDRTGADRAIAGYYWGAKDVLLSIVRHPDAQVRATYDAAYEFIAESR